MESAESGTESGLLVSRAGPVANFTDSPAPRDVNHSSCDVYIFVVGFGLISFVCLFGLVTNFLSLLVLWPDRKCSPTNFLLIVLALVDDLVLVSRFTLRSLPAFCRFTRFCPASYWRAYPHITTHGWPIASLVHLATTYITLQISIHRYIVVCHPYKAKTWGTIKMARLQAIWSLVFVFIFNLPRHFEYQVKYETDGTPYRVRRDFALASPFSVGYTVIAYYLVMYIIPLITLAILNVKLVRVLQASRKRREEMTNNAKEKEDVTVTLVVLVFVFMICQIFNPIRRLLSEVIPHPSRQCGFFYFYYSAFNSLVICINSAVNFVLYCVFGCRFRRDLHRLLCQKNSRIEPSLS